MTDKMNWQGFRSSHKLPASKKEYKSAMWVAYKADDKEAYQKAAEEAEFEIPEEVMAWIEGPKSELQKLKESQSSTEEETKEARKLELSDGFSEEELELLVKNEILTVENLADLATDELTEIFEIDEERAAKLIMSAREEWLED